MTQPSIPHAARDQLETILRELVDWDEVHERYMLEDWGTQILIMADGTVDTLPSGDQFTSSDIIMTLRAVGGNADTSMYSEGWTVLDRDTSEYVTDTGERIDEPEMVRRAIRDGDWAWQYDAWIAEALRLRDFDEEERALFGR